MEVWKTVKDFENYEVSNYGNVRRKDCQVIYSNGMITNYKQKLLTQELNRKTYKRVTFSQNNIQKRYQVHRLVAMYFIPNPNNKPCVNHIDGNGSNNHVSNLEWCSYSENEIHSYNALGKVNPIRKLKESDILDIRQNCIKGINNSNKGNVIDFVNKYKVDRTTILNVLNKKYYGVT
jgi:hypothetical protein